MIDDVLKEIREAEAKADEIVRDAQNKAKQIAQEAEIAAEKQKKATVAGCRDDRRIALDKAEASAQKRREDIFKKGQKSADELVANHNLAASEKADELSRLLVEKYCGAEKTIG